ncbi:VWA domain-containing protein [Sporosarcina thermotolerans]|uniref:VWA domain-containing protein n=1 Tax=Sporosarcina thermotolerans TaxID=633404 RepID=A0AAW9A5Z5_9BACL|nr:VWA domain-containing protein [Sporosarcina thermotolerans]MDW0115635.1 VWA domain-containing protein [Sporosarcina thermotolerans]WHT47077.1 VWA domain-containing protein [Sporosarcina thermotolerans]
MSQRLQQLRDEAILPTFEPLLSDIWASQFKMKPEISVNKIDDILLVNKSFMKVVMTDEYFTYFRNFTRLNDLASAISTIKFGEMINDWLNQKLKEDKNLQEQVRHVQLLLRKPQKKQIQDVHQKKLADAMSEFNAKLQQTIQSNSDSFLQSMEQARKESKQVNDGLKSLLCGISAGNAETTLKKVPLRDQIILAEKLASSKKMREIADWAGRFKQIAQKKQKTKQDQSVERKGVTIGNDIENLLPVELSFFAHRLTKMDFLRRFAESETMQFEIIGCEDLKKGPIVLCLDQSDSMSGLDTKSKGFALALMSIAKKQKRDFCLVLFSSTTQIFEYRKGKIATSQMVRLARTFLGGGTNFAHALDAAVRVISKSRFKQADIVFITDGEDRVTDTFLKLFNKVKREKAFNVLSLIIGNNSNTVEQFSDRLITVKDFDDEGSFTAFEV